MRENRLSLLHQREGIEEGILIERHQPTIHPQDLIQKDWIKTIYLLYVKPVCKHSVAQSLLDNPFMIVLWDQTQL